MKRSLCETEVKMRENGVVCGGGVNLALPTFIDLDWERTATSHQEEREVLGCQTWAK